FLKEFLQRFLILASILLLNKPVLLLDEAFSALDTQNVDRVMKFLVAQKEITMLIVAHNVHYEQYNLKKLYLPDFNQSS
ncbi:MAG: ABC transporter ATP-binding protein, partial [Bacteroidota bacterium]